MSNKLAVITGATKGIGKSLVDTFANIGFNLIVCARNENDLGELKKHTEDKYGITVTTQKCDVSSIKDVQEFVKLINSQSQAPEVLVNNAGVFIPGQIHEEEEGTFEKMIDTNLVSVYHITRGILPKMIKAKRGHIFNMCSTASIMPYVNGGSYCISKFALLGFSKVLREEMKPYNIRVTSVMPGATLTASWEGTDLPEERFMKPEDVANAILNGYQMSSRTVLEEILLRPQLGDL